MSAHTNNADDAEFLKLLVERQLQPMNTESDRPNWTKKSEQQQHQGRSKFEGHAAQTQAQGQGHVFSDMRTSDELSEEMVEAATETTTNSDASSGAVRNTASDPTNTAAWNWRHNKRPSSSPEKAEAASAGAGAGANKLDVDAVLAGSSPLDLVNSFVSLQEQRVQAYKDFNGTFDLLVRNARLEDYPMLCGETTARFAAVSNQILAVKRALVAIGDTYMPRIITKVQDQEQEKLAVVAAMHLDRIQEKLPGMNSVISKQGTSAMGSDSEQRMQHTNQAAYNTKRVCEIEGAVAELLEEVAEVKCELVLG